MFAATFACNTTGTMKHDDRAIRYVNWNIIFLFQGTHAVSPCTPIVLICYGHGSQMKHQFLILCREMGVVLVLWPPYSLIRMPPCSLRILVTLD